MSNASTALTAAGLEPRDVVTGGVPAGFSLKKRVTNTLLKMVEGMPYVVRFDGAIYLAPRENDGRKATPMPADADKAKKEPPHLALITYYPESATEGYPHVLIIPAVLRGELQKAYPDNGYVGKTFCLVKHAIQGKLYKGFEIAEVEVEAGTAVQASAGDQMPGGRKRK